MPDDRFSTDVNSFGAAATTVAPDAFSPTAVRQESVPQALPRHDEDTLVRHQERLIQRAYDESVSTETEFVAHRSRTYRITKRALDISLALPALLVLAPLMLLIAVIIRLDSPGPALFKQMRVGKGGRLFCMYKFRSMTSDAGVIINGLHKKKDDARITRVGRFIRKTSLDELPQLVNVLLGQMSLVGPRPELPEIVLTRYESWQYRRLLVPQGITGWWQVTGRGKKLLWKHTDDDLYYVKRASLLFDVKLLIMTISAVLGRDGAF